MRVKQNDTETFELDNTSVVKHFLSKDIPFSISLLSVSGTHENTSVAEIGYYVLEGNGIIKKDIEITEVEEGDAFYAKKKPHTVEGDMELVVVRTPPAEDPKDEL